MTNVQNIASKESLSNLHSVISAQNTAQITHYCILLILTAIILSVGIALYFYRKKFSKKLKLGLKITFFITTFLFAICAYIPNLQTHTNGANINAPQEVYNNVKYNLPKEQKEAQQYLPFAQDLKKSKKMPKRGTKQYDELISMQNIDVKGRSQEAFDASAYKQIKRPAWYSYL